MLWKYDVIYYAVYSPGRLLIITLVLLLLEISHPLPEMLPQCRLKRVKSVYQEVQIQFLLKHFCAVSSGVTRGPQLRGGPGPKPEKPKETVPPVFIQNVKFLIQLLSFPISM